MTKCFKKSKKLYFGAISGPFFPNKNKNEFSWRKGLFQFLSILIIYHHAKNSAIPEKNAKLTNRQTGRQTDRQTDRRIDRQTDKSDFIVLSVGQGSNINVVFNVKLNTLDC